jgi:hypothetical protein
VTPEQAHRLRCFDALERVMARIPDGTAARECPFTPAIMQQLGKPTLIVNNVIRETAR